MEISLTLSQIESVFSFLGSVGLLFIFLEVLLSFFGRRYDTKN